MDDRILHLVQKKYPQVAEKALQEEIATVGKIMDFKADEIIMDYGSYVRFVPLILEGSIKVSREDTEGNELFLYYLSPGETCSMSFTCCMMNKKSEIRTVAEEDTIVIAIAVGVTFALRFSSIVAVIVAIVVAVVITIVVTISKRCRANKNSC